MPYRLRLGLMTHNKEVMLKVLTSIAVFSALLSSVAGARAWDGAVAGKIRTMEITHGANLAFRVWLADSPTMCATGAKFAFINEADSNYKIYVAALLMAKAQGSTVTIYSSNVDGAYCRIGHLTVSD